ncbi:MAG: protein-glutamate O-methyltransferase CheR [Polyangia bacterium]
MAMQPTASPIAMSEVEFQLLRDLIQARFGLRFDDDTAYLLERRLMPRIESLHLRSFLDYHDFITNPALPEPERERELDEIFDRVATRETYFFRESYQLDAFREELLPLLVKTRPRGRRLSVWSAGCASGEEAYSLAIEIILSGLLGEWDVGVLGSDLSQAALQTARGGAYGPSSFRQTEPWRQQRFFKALTGGRWQVQPEVRRLCTFTRANLISTDWASVGGPFDAIFCRNVIMYFDRVMRSALIQRLASKLVPGGYLFLGHSESLLDLTTPLQIVRLGSALVYRKPPA